jgi:hypothetical protein
MKIALVVALTITSFGLAACGGNGGGGQSDDGAQIRALIDLGNARNPAVCDHVTDRWMQAVIGGDKAACEQQVAASPANAIQVEAISVSGDAATVTALVAGNAAQLSLVKQDGEWKLDGIQR